jgi:molecular chaperone GrpE (heat shock protein)
VTVDSGIPDIQARLDELVDLFRRRLLDDRDKRRLIDEAFERVRSAEEGAFRQSLQPFAVGVALVIDRLDGYTGADPGFAASIRDELLDVLERQGVVEIEAAGPVDPRLHEVSRVVDAVDAGATPTVHHLLRRGYRHGDWVFRAARVVAGHTPSG